MKKIFKTAEAYIFKTLQGRRYVPKWFIESDFDMETANNVEVRASNVWDIYAQAIIKELQNAPATFLREEIIGRTVHPQQMDLAEKYLNEMSREPFCRKYLLARLSDVPFGAPWLCPFFPHASPMSIQHAYYCWMMHKYVGIFLPDNSIQRIVEFGGGYGNFYRLMRLWGYLGEYAIVDLPPMHTLQRHYLNGACGGVTAQQVTLTTLTDQSIWQPHGASCFMATFSLNETPVVTRDIVREYLPSFEAVFIVYNSSFDGVDNRQYFNSMAEYLRPNFKVITFMDTYRKAWFLMGRKH